MGLVSQPLLSWRVWHLSTNTKPKQEQLSHVGEKSYSAKCEGLIPTAKPWPLRERHLSYLYYARWRRFHAAQSLSLVHNSVPLVAWAKVRGEIYANTTTIKELHVDEFDQWKIDFPRAGSITFWVTADHKFKWGFFIYLF